MSNVAFTRVVMLEQSNVQTSKPTFSLYYPTQQQLLKSLGVEWRDEYGTA